MDLADIVVPAGGAFEDLPASYANFLSMSASTGTMEEDAGIWSELGQAYLAAPSFADAPIGKGLDAVDANGLWDSSTAVL